MLGFPVVDGLVVGITGTPIADSSTTSLVEKSDKWLQQQLI